MKFQREDGERGRRIRDGYDEKTQFSANRSPFCIPIYQAAPLYPRYRALTIALAGLSCYTNNNSVYLVVLVMAMMLAVQS